MSEILMNGQVSQRSNSSGRRPWRLIAVVLWLGFSITLAIWWMIFGLKQIDRIAELGGLAPAEITSEIARQHRMLMSEGASLVLMLLLGGAALLYYMNIEIKRSKKLKEFFAAFTHDLKTSLASLRLQAESLEEDLRDSNHARLMKRLVKDTVRLELQLENALLLASPEDSSRFLFEGVVLVDILKSMEHQWPDLKMLVIGSAIVHGDQRAIESILKNLLQNAVVHGRANQVTITISEPNEADMKAQVRIRIEDNGRGFHGQLSELGEMFARHSSSSGSGLGLHLAKRLASSMKGDLIFCPSSQGFCVEILLPKFEKSMGSILEEAR